MTNKPTTATGYVGDDLRLVKSTCLYVATKLGDMLDDIVIVGGLAPSLLVDQTRLPAGLDPHAGTKDLDMGLSLAILEGERYQELSARLRNAGFEQDVNEDGNLTNQRWRITSGMPVTIDFLIPPSGESDLGGKLCHIQPGFAAVITPGLHLAFRDRRSVRVSDVTPSGEKAVRDIWVCGPGALLVLKALAFKNRGVNKDAYDLIYVLRGLGVKCTARRLRLLMHDSHVGEALAIIKKDFTDHDGIGPRRVAEFMTGAPDDDIQADVVGLALNLLREAT